MSRIGNRVLEIPEGVTVEIREGNNNLEKQVGADGKVSFVKKNTPSVWSASFLEISDWYKPPIWTNPVGLGANLVTIAPSFKFLLGYFSS